MTILSNFVRTLGMTLAAFVILVGAVAPQVASATDIFGYDYIGGDYGYDSYDYYGGDYGYDTYDYYGGDYGSDTYDYYGGDYGYDTSYSDYYTAPSYSSGYSSGGSYSYPSYSSGYSYGSSYSTPSYSVPSYSYSNTNVETCNATNSCNDNSVEDNDTHTETCSATNSCNDNSNHSYDYDYTSNYTSTWTDNSVHDYSSTYIDNSVFHSDDHSVVNIQNPAPQPYIVYKDRERDRDRDDDRHYDRDYDVCYNLPGFQDYVPNGYYVSGGNCFYQQYNTPAPYVSLSAVPYTGLEMGPTATALYWGFLVLWCAVAAYLIAVKKVQNKLVNGLNTFLFPATAHTSGHAQVSVSETKEVAKTNTDGIDPFIASQLGKYR